MRAMVLDQPRTPLRDSRVPDPVPASNQVLVRIAACGVCRTDLHVVDGDLTEPKLPIIPGHEIVGRIEALGASVTDFRIGERVGIPWLGHTCGRCAYCRMGAENLCDAPGFTGYQIDGGYAELTVADAAYCFRLPETYDDVSAAPLLCAGLIGYRALAHGWRRKEDWASTASAPQPTSSLRWRASKAARSTLSPGRATRRPRILRAGSAAYGPEAQTSSRPATSTPRLSLRPSAAWSRQRLSCVRKGGIVVLGGIHMSDVPAMPYSLLWGERVVRSVANLTRQDAKDFLALAGRTADRNPCRAVCAK